MKHRSKGRSQATVSTPSGGPVFVSLEDQKRMSRDTWPSLASWEALIRAGSVSGVHVTASAGALPDVMTLDAGYWS